MNEWNDNSFNKLSKRWSKNVNDTRDGLTELERKEGFVDSTGKIAIPLNFDAVDDFSEGFAAVGNYIMRDSYHDFGYSKKQIDSLQKEAEKLFENTTTDNYRNLLSNPTYQEYSMATMQMPSEKLIYGYINEKGEVLAEGKSVLEKT